LDGLQQAKALGLVEPCLIGRRADIVELAQRHGWDPATVCVASADDVSEAGCGGRSPRSRGASRRAYER
jgi:hypothetical protein